MIDVAKRQQRVVQGGTQQRSGPHYQRAPLAFVVPKIVWLETQASPKVNSN
jgi:hypothetical protein